MTEEPRPDDLTNVPSGPPAYSQPGGYEQPAYQQPSYAPPPTYQQPTYQQPAYQPPTYQQPTGYQQPGVGQQPGYGQQPQQPGWNQQPGYQQPGYPQQQPAWGQQPTYWNAGAATEYGYNTSILAIIAGVVLLLWGLLWTFGGIALIAVSNATGLITDNLGQNLADSIHNIIVVVGAVVLIVGLLQLLSALGVWLHKSWARILGILFGILGTLLRPRRRGGCRPEPKPVRHLVERERQQHGRRAGRARLLRAHPRGPDHRRRPLSQGARHLLASIDLAARRLSPRTATRLPTWEARSDSQRQTHV